MAPEQAFILTTQLWAALKGAHWTDWYLNRAMECLFKGADWNGRQRRPDGLPYKRDDACYAVAALKKVQTWRRLAAEIEPVESRGLVPGDLDDAGHLLLSIRRLDSVTELLLAMRQLRSLRRPLLA